MTALGLCPSGEQGQHIGIISQEICSCSLCQRWSSPRKSRLGSERGWRSLGWCFSRRGSGYLAACGPAARYRVICSPFVRQMFWGGHLGAPQPQNSGFHNFCQHRLTCKSLQLFSISPRLGSYRRCAALPGEERKAKSVLPSIFLKAAPQGLFLSTLWRALKYSLITLLRDSCPRWDCICQQLSVFNHFSSKNWKIIFKSILI